MSWHLSLPYWLTAVGSALAVGFAWLLPRDLLDVKPSVRRLVQGTRRPREWVSELKSVLGVLANAPILFLIMLQGVAIFVLARICQLNLFHPLLILKSFQALGSGNPEWLRRGFKSRMSDLNEVFLWTGISALCLLALTVNGKWGTLVSLSVFSFAVGACFPIQRQLFNDSIPQARYRATLMSIESILDRAVCAWVATLLGAFISDGKIENFLRYSAGLTGAGILILLVILASSRYAASRHFTKAR
jgi:hypothetical protein